MAILFWLPWANKMSYIKPTNMWRKRTFSAFPSWLCILCSIFGLPVAIKTKLPKISNFDVKLKENQNWQFLAILFWSPRVNQMCYRKSTTIWRKLTISSFSTWLWIFCSPFGLPVVIKIISPKITNFDVTWVMRQNQFCTYQLITPSAGPREVKIIPNSKNVNVPFIQL